MTDQDPTPPRARPARAGPIQYKGSELEAERGPGLGCFWTQVIVLAVLVVLTPLSVAWHWPTEVSAILLFAVIGLLLVTGQTIIFLLRLVAADRRGRRRPLGSATQTVGELEDGAAPSRRPRRVRRTTGRTQVLIDPIDKSHASRRSRVATVGPTTCPGVFRSTPEVIGP